MRTARGATLLELLVAMTVGLFLFLSVIGTYSQGSNIKEHIRGSARIQDNARVGIDRLERDLVMTGFGVPTGVRVGSTTLWTPAIFYASSTAIGFRAEIDRGNAEVICTPRSTNADCPLSKLRLDAIDYYQGLACVSPAGGNLAVVVALDGGEWQPVTCSAVNTGDASITVTTLTNGKFTAGASEVLTIEQIYLRYVAGSQPPYGRLLRQLRYQNTPDSTFPASSVTPEVVAQQLIDFVLEYYDESGTQLTGNPLDATQRAAIRSIVIFMEGYDQVGPDGHPQLLQVRSQVLLRNVG